MSHWIILLGLAIAGGWFRYNLNMSEATAKISQSMASGDVEPGLQDAITPPLLALNYYACFVVTVGAYFGLPTGADWSILLVLLALWLGAASAPASLVPPADSPYWVRRVYRSLRERGRRYTRRGKKGRADTMTALADRLERTFPDALQSPWAPATK